MRALFRSVVWTALLVCLWQCKNTRPPGPKPKDVSDLLATLPAEVTTLWAPDFDRGLHGVLGFVTAVSDANVVNGLLDDFSARTGVDLRTTRAWNTLGVDTAEGIAILTGSLEPTTMLASPTVVMKTRDPVRLDKFINLYAETRSETDGHAIGDVHGATVHSYRGVHWSHVGAYTWLTLGRSGRLAMDHMLLHLHRDNGAVVPEHPLTADPDFATDMNRVRPSMWMGRWQGGAVGEVHVQGMVLGLDVSEQGIRSQVFMGGDFMPVPANATSLEMLVRRYAPSELIFSAAQYLDFNYAAAPAPVVRTSRRGRPVVRPSVSPNDTNARLEYANPLEQAFGTFTGLNWRTEIAPDVRGFTLGAGLVGLDASSARDVKVSVTVDVADGARAVAWVARAAQTMGQHNVTFRQSAEAIAGLAVPVYRADWKWSPLQRDEDRLSLSMAVVHQTIILALGAGALEEKVHAVVDPNAASVPWLAHPTWTARGTQAQGYGVLRVGSLGRMVGKWTGDGNARTPAADANAHVPPVADANAHPPTDANTPAQPPSWAALGRAMQRLGDFVSTTTNAPGGRIVEWSTDFSSVPDPPGFGTAGPSTKAPDLPELAMLIADDDRGRVWLHSASGRGASFVSGTRYSEKVYLSQPDAVRNCRRACWNNPKCSGFFEQTKACPEPRRSDQRSDPRRTRGRGCVRVCGFFTEGPSPLRGNLAGGPTGSVWIKSDTFKGASPDKWFGQKPRETAGP